jgi:hypothetical protein
MNCVCVYTVDIGYGKKIQQKYISEKKEDFILSPLNFSTKDRRETITKNIVNMSMEE